MKPRRTVFYVSDRTGITAESFGRTLLTQFPGVELPRRVLPFVDSRDKAEAARAEINAVARREAVRPIVFCTLIDDAVRAIIASADALCLDLFAGFIGQLETELGRPSSHTMGLTHGMGSPSAYEQRMGALNYTLAHDDGLAAVHYADADAILIGVSRTGKTPTCLYLAMQYGLRAANYPITPDDLAHHALPRPLAPYRAKLFGLTIAPERLSAIRNERKPGSHYASLENCRTEVEAVEKLLRHEQVPVLDTTAMSVEEIAITLLHRMGLVSRLGS